MRRPESGLGQTKPLKLQRPFGRRITQGGDADAARKPPFDCSLDQSWRDECHRYRHVDMTNAALLARGNGFRIKVDVIVTTGTPGALAAQQATSVIPVVMTTVADPVGSGLVASLARPGGNVTGLSLQQADLAGKRLELLREVIPA